MQLKHLIAYPILFFGGMHTCSQAVAEEVETEEPLSKEFLEFLANEDEVIINDWLEQLAEPKVNESGNNE